jgi:methylated-DNA-[protein]-cysteine S-methyltransferase
MMTTEPEPLINDLRHLHTDTTGHLSRLREQLAATARTRGLLDIVYRTVDTPLGRLLLAATEHGLVRVAFEIEDEDAVLQSLADKLSPRILHQASRLEPVVRELNEYFSGDRRSFDLPLDWSLAHGFRNTVLHQLPGIAYGRTASYAAVAALAGSPRAVRAVGTACATNPLPIVVPCHRVVRSDGTMGAYRGGPEAKKALLDMEAAA